MVAGDKPVLLKVVAFSATVVRIENGPPTFNALSILNEVLFVELSTQLKLICEVETAVAVKELGAFIIGLTTIELVAELEQPAAAIRP